MCEQLKDVCRRELDHAEAEASRNSAIITDYKQVGDVTILHAHVRLNAQQAKLA